MMRLGLFSMLLLALTATTGCGGGALRVVNRTPNGGTVALQGTKDTARARAKEFIREQCPFGYDLRDGDTASRQVTDSRTEGEWRVEYHCKDVPGTAAHPQPTREVAVHI